MKIQTPTPPLAPRSGPVERKRTQEGAPPQKAPEGGDTVQISSQAAALRSAADATRVAGETRDLIAAGNREAVVAQPVDTQRLLELMKATGATREISSPGND